MVSEHLGAAVMVGLVVCSQRKLPVMSLLTGGYFNESSMHVPSGSSWKHTEANFAGRGKVLGNFSGTGLVLICLSTLGIVRSEQGVGACAV